MGTIRVDDQVEAALARLGGFGESYNDVLRRLLNVPDRAEASGRWPRDARKMRAILAAGLLAPGAALTWHRRNLDVTHTAVVLPDGRIRTEDGAVHGTPSGAADHVTGGYPAKGWRVWLTEDGRTLGELLAQIPTETL